MKFVMVLKDEGNDEFRMEHVERLARQIDANTSRPHENIAFTNLEWPKPDGVRMLPLVHDLPGWWSMMEMYRAHGPVIYMDLDMAIAGSLDKLVDRVEKLEPAEIMLLRKFRPVHPPFQTGITCWNGDHASVLHDFLLEVAAGEFDPFRQNGRLVRAGRLRTRDRTWATDEEWLCHYLPQHKKIVPLQDELPENYVQSYKRHLNWGCEPAEGSIVVFHGTPRPWEVDW